jgi:hypothetical protein
MLRRRPRSRPRSAGISTAEVLASSALTLLVLAAISSFYQTQMKAFAAQSAYAESQTITRSVMELMTRELRMASYTTTAVPATVGNVVDGIVTATPTSIRFQQDLNADADVADPGEDLTYALVGDQLLRTDGAGAPIPLVTGIPEGGFALRYFTLGDPVVEIIPVGALTAGQRRTVAKVRITVTGQVPNPDPHNTAPLLSQVESEVAIRSRSLNNF